MSILTILVVLVVIGFALWLATVYIPMPEIYKRVVIAIVVILVLLWLIRVVASSGALAIP